MAVLMGNPEYTLMHKAIQSDKYRKRININIFFEQFITITIVLFGAL